MCDNWCDSGLWCTTQLGTEVKEKRWSLRDHCISPENFTPGTLHLKPDTPPHMTRPRTYTSFTFSRQSRPRSSSVDSSESREGSGSGRSSRAHSEFYRKSLKPTSTSSRSWLHMITHDDTWWHMITHDDFMFWIAMLHFTLLILPLIKLSFCPPYFPCNIKKLHLPLPLPLPLPGEQLALMGLLDGANKIEFTVTSASRGQVTISCKLYVWFYICIYSVLSTA